MLLRSSFVFKRIVSAVAAVILFGFLVPIEAQASATGCSADHCIFDNEILRFGNGGQGQPTYTPSEDSVNPSSGLFNQPFYKSANGNWYKLTYSSYPLDMALGSGTSGSNWTGNTIQEVSGDFSPFTSGLTIDYSGFVQLSTGGTSPNTWAKGYGVITVKGTMTLNSQSVEITQRYELGRTSQFVKISTTVKNLDSSSISNLNIWVGTRDDYVGTSDQPAKTRGNLDGAGGSFRALTNASDKASALQITTANEGALFYSTSPNADISFQNCCSFSNAYNTMPRDSNSYEGEVIANIQSQPADGSYAAIYRPGDISSNASVTIDWFYAAGAIADLDAVAQSVASAAAPALPEAQREDGEVVLTWLEPNSADPITNYSIRYRVVGVETWTVIIRNPPRIELFETITGLSNELTYEFQVSAVTTSLSDSTTTQGDWSGSSPAEILGSPTAPTGLSAVGGDSSATISFTPATAIDNETATITNYEYFIGSPETWTALTPADTNSPIFIPGLENGRSYDIRVRAVNGYGPGPSALIEGVVTLPVFSDSQLESAIDLATPYTDSVTATAGVTYSISAGAIPTGLSFNSLTGRFSGTPSAEGRYTFTITATNSAGSVSQTYTLTTPGAEPEPTPPGPPAVPQPRFLSIPMFSGEQNQPFSLSISAENVSRFEVEGSLPEGVTLDPVTGVMSGTPTQAGVFRFILILRGPQVGIGQQFDFAVAPAPKPTPTLEALPIPQDRSGRPWIKINDAQIVGGVRPNNTSDGLEVQVESGWKLSLQVNDANQRPVPLDPQNRLRMVENQLVNVAGDGFKSSSEVRVYLFSSPYLLGTALTNEQGSFTATFSLPTDVTTGDHMIQVNGISPTNDLRSISLPAIYEKAVAVPEIPSVVIPDTPSIDTSVSPEVDDSATATLEETSTAITDIKDEDENSSDSQTGTTDDSEKDEAESPSPASKTIRIVIPFKGDGFKVDKRAMARINAVSTKISKDIKSLRVVGFANSSDEQKNLKTSLNRALEVRKKIAIKLPKTPFKVRGSGLKQNPLCSRYQNSCVVVYVQS